MTRLETMRQKAQLALTISIGAGVVVYGLAAVFVAPGRLLTGLVLLGLVAAAAIFTWRASPNTVASRCTTAASVMAFPAAITYMMQGQSWQIDMHMVFFASLAVTAAMIDWRAILAAAAVTAVHRF